jgi:hypothetical protein
MSRHAIRLAALFLVVPATASAQYSLFRPVPAAQMRDLSTDRPDKTESPYTVDAGHVQLEFDVVNVARTHEGNATSLGWGLAAVNAKVGLASRIDLQILAEPFTGSRLTINDISSTESGAGVFGARLKLNLIGNDGGSVAFGVMPFVVSTPTEAGRIAEYGLILPVAGDLGRGWGFGAMAEFDVVGGAANREVRYVATATVGRDLSARVGMYAEIASDAGDGPWVGSFDLGTTLAFGSNAQLDGGINLGLSDASDAVNPFLGFTVRF